jgi:hypothetical protein
VSLRGFSQVCFEDHSTNRMVEALRLFEELCKSRYLPASVAVTLVLTKWDLFEAKLPHTPLHSIPDVSN